VLNDDTCIVRDAVCPSCEALRKAATDLEGTRLGRTERAMLLSLPTTFSAFAAGENSRGVRELRPSKRSARRNTLSRLRRKRLASARAPVRLYAKDDLTIA
jgi:hypothetical protein